jgi:UDP-xylose:glucoside alpha-1,3-xylosyltransferase
VLAVVACGDRLSETLVMIKSAILFTKKPLNFIVLADDALIASFKEKVTFCSLNILLLKTKTKN